MKNIAGIFSIIRPSQWYKNLVVFLALFFSSNLFNLFLFKKSFLGFIALILISSANYIINDLFDEKRDKICPEKQNRALISGVITRKTSIVVFTLLFLGSLCISYFLINTSFLLVVFCMFIISSLYTVSFKNIPVLDVISIASLFFLRTIAGGFAIGFSLNISLAWGIFILSCFFVSCKRYGEKNIFGPDGVKYKPVLKYYSKDFLFWVSTICLAVLLFMFIFFSIKYYNYRLLWTTPFFSFMLCRYYYLAFNKRFIIAPEKVFHDKYIMFSGLLYLVLSIICVNYL